MAIIKISKKNLFHNLKLLTLKSGSKKRLSAVLKDNAYGHGIELIAKLVSEYGLQEAVVINNEEANKIGNYFKNILILNDTPTNSVNFSYAIGDIEALEAYKGNAKIELKIDTGMRRNGIDITQLQEALKIIKQNGINLFGLFTHYRSADELSSEFAWQKVNFEQVKREVLQKGYKPRFHSYNSAALLRSSSFNEDIARVGISMYGYTQLPNFFNIDKLKPVLSLWTKRISTHALKKGQRVGYGGDFIAPKDMIVSAYDIGYGDGLFRGNSKNSLIIKENLPILGKVSMDFISIESKKEEICIFDDAKELANHFDTISYEITTSLKPSIKRVLTDTKQK